MALKPNSSGCPKNTGLRTLVATKSLRETDQCSTEYPQSPADSALFLFNPKEKMSSQKFESFSLSSGLQVVVESMSGVESAALTLMIPAGSVLDRPGKSGTAAILSEMFPRGAGQLSARELSAAMDNLGLQRSVSGGVGYMTLSAATTADRIAEAIPLIASLITAPHLDEEQFGPSRELVQQALSAIEDEPRQRLGQFLRRCSYSPPWGNPAEGSLVDVPEITLQDVQQHYSSFICPNHAVIGVAGNVIAAELQDAVAAAFDGWIPKDVTVPDTGDVEASPKHVEHDSAQTHIGLAWETVPYRHERYFEAWAAVSLLSGGMSSRLFTEVREKRGLCYAISASINTQKDQARVFGYAGTTNERAQETLDVMVAEIRRLHEGITEDELQRCKARAKSTLIMQQESTMSRSSSLARDTLHLGRVLGLQEIRSRIDSLTVDQVRDFALEYAPNSMVLVTIGPDALGASCLKAAVPAV
ncbi:MAG TPA: insulinase family protein [Planctomycetes bacterium]|nr:insulinase family protein [Fuerstiella sp.]HIK92064.1 insulinase family protein [Planctomycetota bacterium]